MIFGPFICSLENEKQYIQRGLKILSVFSKFHWKIWLTQLQNLYLKMHNKSRDKIAPRPPIPLKTTSTLNKQTSIKPIESNILPAIKPRKQSLTKPTSKSKTSNNTAEKQETKSTKRIVTTQTAKKMPITKEKPIKNNLGWGNLSFSLLIDISEFCCTVPFDVYRLSLVCSTWRQLMLCQNAVCFWNRFKKTEKVPNFKQFKLTLQSQLQQIKQKRSFQFEQMFTKLFNYGSTKENIPNKLINKLKLEIDIVINKRKLSNYPYKLRNFNFSSYVYAKILELNQIAFDMYTPHNFFKDLLEISITFYSRTFKVSYTLNYKFKPEQIAECAVRQKAFNYFIDKNLIITFFDGDKTFLYSFLEISVLQLITEFRKVIKKNFQGHIDQKMKKVPLYKQLCETQFENFVEYLKFQADFQLHMSYHNSLKQIFTHCDTKVYPLQYDQKSAYFQVKINDTFNKTSTFLLDNKMGMSESIPDLYLLDFVLKDRDRFLIVYSGFIYAREATQKQRESIENYFEFNDFPIKVLQYKAQKYEFHIIIIEESKKNFIKNTTFRLYP